MNIITFDISILSWLMVTFLTSITVCQIGHRDWEPIKPGLLEPKDFKAFFTQPVGCQVELIFSRDVNDLTYEYDAYCVYDDGYQYYLLPLNLNNQTTPLAINSADPNGQRGAFLLSTNYTLTPIIVDICRIGFGNPEFPYKYQLVKPTTFIIRAIPSGSERSSEQIGESWWESGPFHLHQYPLTPQDGGVYNLTAIAYKPDPKVEVWYANISWQSILPSSEIDSFFILTGPSHDAKSIQSIQIIDANATSASIKLNQFDSKVDYDIAIAVYTTAGALTSPFDVPQIHILTV